MWACLNCLPEIEKKKIKNKSLSYCVAQGTFDNLIHADLKVHFNNAVKFDKST